MNSNRSWLGEQVNSKLQQILSKIKPKIKENNWELKDREIKDWKDKK
jgi:hypothetical protein